MPQKKGKQLAKHKLLNAYRSYYFVFYIVTYYHNVFLGITL